MMNNQLRLLGILLALPVLAIGLAAPAQAQWHDSMGGSFNNPISSSFSSAIWGNMQMQQNLNMQRMLWNSTVNRQQRQTTSGTTTSRAVAGSGAGFTASSGATTFRPAAPQLLPRTLAAQLGSSAAQRQQYEQLLTLTLQLYQQLEPRMRPQSSRSAPASDVARALAFYIVSSYQVYAQGRSSAASQPTGEQYEELCRTVRAYLLQSAQFNTLSNRDKQQMYEALAITGTLPRLADQYGEQQHDQQLRQQAHQLAAQNLERLGVRADQIRFTEKGLVIR